MPYAHGSPSGTSPCLPLQLAGVRLFPASAIEGAPAKHLQPTFFSTMNNGTLVTISNSVIGTNCRALRNYAINRWVLDVTGSADWETVGGNAHLACAKCASGACSHGGAMQPFTRTIPSTSAQYGVKHQWTEMPSLHQACIMACV
jgi:hypothetical protein